MNKTGFILIDKPVGPTSHDVVNKGRRALSMKKIGHAGTLDPFASGLLILCIGTSTRLSEYFLHYDKTYIFTLRLGHETDSCDNEGKIIAQGKKKPENINEPEIRNVLHDFTGEIDQVPPVYSARRIKGRRLYEYARSGEIVEIPSRKVIIHELNLFEFSPPDLTLEARVSSGTYIRALGRDIGQSLGTLATVEKLRRTKIGNHSLENSIPLEILETEEGIEEHILPPERLFPGWPRILVKGDALKRVKNGNFIPAIENMPCFWKKETPLMLLDDKQRVVAVAMIKKSPKGEKVMQPVKVLISN